jgi:hypothetical protein
MGSACLINCLWKKCKRKTANGPKTGEKQPTTDAKSKKTSAKESQKADQPDDVVVVKASAQSAPEPAKKAPTKTEEAAPVTKHLYFWRRNSADYPRKKRSQNCIEDEDPPRQEPARKERPRKAKEPAREEEEHERGRRSRRRRRRPAEPVEVSVFPGYPRRFLVWERREGDGLVGYTTEVIAFGSKPSEDSLVSSLSLSLPEIPFRRDLLWSRPATSVRAS